jgi:hypothetical protein
MPRKRTQKATGAIIESAERTAKAIELRKSGATFKKIGDHFGISAQSAHEMVTKGLKATLAEPAAELRALAVERLDHMLAAIWKAASNGDLRAQAMVLRIEERRAKLLGLDATQRLEEVAPAEDVKASLLAKLNKNLAVAAITLWNTVYLGRAVDQLRSRGEIIGDTLLAHIAPLGWEHITFNGDYVWPTEPLQYAFQIRAQPSSIRLSVGFWEDSAMTPNPQSLRSVR